MKNSKSTKRGLAALALVLAGGIAAGGTLAYLSDTSGTVTNTFQSVSKLVNDKDKDFVLKEHEVTYDATKSGYNLKTTFDEDGKITYDKLVPGSEAEKDPTVYLKNLNSRSYLFIVETEALDTKTFEYAVDEADGSWVQLKNGAEPVLTADNQKVWVWNSVVEEFTSPEKEFPILKDEKVTVLTTAKEGFESDNLSFQAHLVQATGFDTALEAWNAYQTPAANPGK